MPSSRKDRDGDTGRGIVPTPNLLEWIAISATGLALAIYLPIVVHRTVNRGFGDVQVYFRAAWAVWTGYPLYEVTDHHGWSYHYPPTLALVMAPFSNALPGFAQPAWALPYPVAVAVWYAICAAALLASVHIWASALERHAGFDARPGYWNAWWMLRLGPLLALLPFAGDGLGRGQPTALLLLSVVAFLGLYAQGSRKAAAFALAAGITIKMFPAALAIIPFLRRDLKMLIWIGVWCAILLVLLPAVLVGPAATLDLYRALWSERLAGIFSGAPKERFSSEISFLAYDMASIGSTLARIAQGGRPAQPIPLPAWASIVQLVCNLLLVGWLIRAGHGRFWRLRGEQPGDPYAILIAGPVLWAALPAMLTVAQTHYWAQAIPLVGIAVVEAWRRAGRIGISPVLLAWGALAWFGAIATETTIWQPLRVIGLSTFVVMGLVVWGLALLARGPETGAQSAE